MTAVLQGAAARWARFFETLTPDSLDELEGLCRSDVRFADPFNDVQGVDALRRIFAHMFETSVDPRFTVFDTAIGDAAVYYRWRFAFRPRSRSTGPDWVIDGVSEVRFDEDGLVVSHIDHWDAASQVHARLPLVGRLMRWLSRRFTA